MKRFPILPVISMLTDFCAASLYVFFAAPDAVGDIHPALKLLFCAAAAVAVYLLTLVPFYLGRVFQLAAAAALSRAVSDIADAFYGGAVSALREDNFPLWLAAATAVFALSLFLHLRRTLGENLGVQFAHRSVPDHYDPLPDEEMYDEEDDDEIEEADAEYEEGEEYDDGSDLTDDPVNDNIRAMAAASDSYRSAVDRTRRHFDAIKSGEYLISGEQLTVISGIAEEFEQLVNNASDIFIAFDDDGGQTDASSDLSAVAGRMDSLAAIMENIVAKLPLADEQPPALETRPESSAYFNGCRNITELRKRYKSLSKIFHPDTEMGDTESMQRINDEFERMKSALRGERS